MWLCCGEKNLPVATSEAPQRPPAAAAAATATAAPPVAQVPVVVLPEDPQELQDLFHQLLSRVNTNQALPKDSIQLKECVKRNPSLCAIRYDFGTEGKWYPLHKLCMVSKTQTFSYDNGTTTTVVTWAFTTSIDFVQQVYHAFPNATKPNPESNVESEGRNSNSSSVLETPLILACGSNAPFELVTFLATQDPQLVETPTRYSNELPFFAACACSSFQVVEYLAMCYPEAVTTPNKHGTFPIHVVCDRRPFDFQRLEFLLWMDAKEGASRCSSASGVSNKPLFRILSATGYKPTLNVIQLLIIHNPQYIYQRLYDFQESNKLPVDRLRENGAPPAIVEFVQQVTDRYLLFRMDSFPHSVEEAQVELEYCRDRQNEANKQKAAQQKQGQQESSKSFWDKEEEMIQSLLPILPTIHEIQGKIDNLSQGIALNSIQGLSPEKLVKLSVWKLKLFQSQKQRLEQSLEKAKSRRNQFQLELLRKKNNPVPLCKTPGCELYPNDEFDGGLCERCFTKFILQERREDYVVRNDRYTPQASEASKEAIQQEVNRVHKLNPVERDQWGRRYLDPESIWNILQTSTSEGYSICLLRASWLMKQTTLPKRPLPPDAVIGLEELQTIYHESQQHQETLTSIPLPIIAISHCWQTKNHPDPHGETCRRIVQALKDYWPVFKVPDMGIFIDLSSLYQDPRTESQGQAFKAALGSMSLWYGHALTTVWMVTNPYETTLSYWDRGWTAFEYNLSDLVKPSNSSQYSRWPQLLDLGKASTPKVAQASSGVEALSPQALLYRPPPADPMAFFEDHAFGSQIYTNDADRDIVVAPQFQQAVFEILAGVKILNFNGVSWGEKEVHALIRVLPLCRNLERLQLAGNNISNDSFTAIVKCINAQRKEQKNLLKLEQIWTYMNPEGGRSKSALDEGIRIFDNSN